ncbi:MAG: GNAT family N-acetyltransferase [Anaerolineae bacterium]|nr:GNAT family N-acetyltransferase [Anaerolineae bacterium]
MDQHRAWRPAQLGQGYGRAAIALALAFAFDELNLHRVQLTVFSYNTRAIALYEGLGFRREGVYREFLHRDGARHDMLLYGLLAREWRAQRERAAS